MSNRDPWLSACCSAASSCELNSPAVLESTSPLACTSTASGRTSESTTNNSIAFTRFDALILSLGPRLHVQTTDAMSCRAAVQRLHEPNRPPAYVVGSPGIRWSTVNKRWSNALCTSADDGGSVVESVMSCLASARSLVLVSCDRHRST